MTRSKLNSSLEQNVILRPIPLQFEGSDYQLFISHSFRFIHDDNEDLWRVTSLNYAYAIEIARSNQEVVAFHWEGHTNGKAPFAHLHLGFANEDNAPLLGSKAHVPTGRVAIEDVIYFLIQELKVRPKRQDWEDVLSEVRKPFMKYKTW